MMAIPPEVWSTIAENCCDHKSRVRSHYFWRESKAVGNFYAGLFLATLVIAALLVGGLLVFDSFVMPASLAAEGMGEADWDLETWKRNLTTGRNNVADRFETWHLEDGGSREEAATAKHFLWKSIPVAAVIGLCCVALFARLTSFGYSMALDDLVGGVNERNRSKIVRHYLRTSAQREGNWDGRADRPIDDSPPQGSQSGNRHDTR